MDRYENPQERLIFVMGAFCHTKQSLVTEFGLGEKAPLTLYAWKDGQIGAIVQCSPKLDRLEQERYEVIVNTAFVLRRNLAVEAFTLAAEGFRCRARTDVPLVDRFASGDPEVEECIAVWHSQPRQSLVATKPFTYGLGRVVQYGEINVEAVGSGAGYPDSLQLVFEAEPGLAPLPRLESLGLKVWVAR